MKLPFPDIHLSYTAAADQARFYETLGSAQNLVALKTEKIQADIARLKGRSGPSRESILHLGATLALQAHQAGRLVRTTENATQLRLDKIARGLGLFSRAALTSSDIPLPIRDSGEFVEKIRQAGTARSFGTVFPMSIGRVTVNNVIPTSSARRLAPSSVVPELDVKVAQIIFDGQKFIGLNRVPSQLGDDILALGAFLYANGVRTLARAEDQLFWVGDTSEGFTPIKGAGAAAEAAGCVLQLAAGKTRPADITLSTARALRAEVSVDALDRGAYYLNRSGVSAPNSLCSVIWPRWRRIRSPFPLPSSRPLPPSQSTSSRPSDR